MISLIHIDISSLDENHGLGVYEKLARSVALNESVRNIGACRENHDLIRAYGGNIFGIEGDYYLKCPGGGYSQVGQEIVEDIIGRRNGIDWRRVGRRGASDEGIAIRASLELVVRVESRNIDRNILSGDDRLGASSNFKIRQGCVRIKASFIKVEGGNVKKKKNCLFFFLSLITFSDKL